RDAIRAVFQALLDARNQMSGADWAEFASGIRSHELWDVFCQDPLTRRAFEKPRGYAGDAVMMDFVYGIHHHHAFWAVSSRWMRTPTACAKSMRNMAGSGWRRCTHRSATSSPGGAIWPASIS